MNKKFEGKTALVTGGNSGIGKAIALAFASEGCNVVIAARRSDEGEQTAREIIKHGGNAQFIKTDVTSRHDIKTMVDTCISEFGQLDYAINNAGIFGPARVATADYDEETWDRVMNTNLKGMWLCMKQEIPVMLQQGSGVIINMSSVAGLIASLATSAYCVSKHGIIGLTKVAAKEYAAQGIRVNAICPAIIETPMSDEVVKPDNELTAQLKLRYPVGRFGTPEEVAGAALFLCSDEASFITGQALPVDGGRLLV